MNHIHPEQKIISNTTNAIDRLLRSINRPMVFSNGCFDILHKGHVDYLFAAAEYGDSLVIGLNSDASVKLQNKGDDRPINHQDDRAFVLAGLSCVDAVILFDQETPKHLIEQLTPDFLIKGGDWAIEDIVGSEHVTTHAGKVLTIPFRFETSTTQLIKKIRA